jgi:Flp pilus assembly protein TadD
MSNVRALVPALACRAAVVVCLAALSAACASGFQPGRAAAPDYPEWLLSGERLFGEPIRADELPEIPISEPTPQMRAFVAELMDGIDRRNSASRFRALFGGLVRNGYFNSVYSANQTLTAAETFEIKGGNCLSYTNLFIALAREAGLDASYQLVDVPPSWDADSEFIIRYTHINVLVRGLRLEPGSHPLVTVDFNDVLPGADYRRWTVSDDYASSLFYANRSVSLLREGQVRDSFLHLRRALDIEPGNLDLWINLGAFYATRGDYEGSIEAYHVALQLSPHNRAALSGLARSYANHGDETMAALYQQRVRNYREANPYYHYAMAQAAFERDDYEASLVHINNAIGLKRRAHRFYLLRALVQDKLGLPDAAQSSLRRAHRLGLDDGVKSELLRSVGMASL